MGKCVTLLNITYTVYHSCYEIYILKISDVTSISVDYFLQLYCLVYIAKKIEKPSTHAIFVFLYFCVYITFRQFPLTSCVLVRVFYKISTKKIAGSMRCRKCVHS